MKKFLLHTLSILLVVMTLFGSVAFAANEEENAWYERILSELQTPAAVGLFTGRYELHTHDSAYVPDVAPELTPFDQKEETLYPPVNGSFESTDESIVTVDENGLMTGQSAGSCKVIYHSTNGDIAYQVTVSDEALPETIKNYIYVLLREFNTVKRSRLPKYNQYAKWYYGRKKEVGWCSVFTIYCANAAGNPVPKAKEVNRENQSMVQFFAEGQVGNQYDGFMKLGRFVGIPKPGYLVIYAEMKNSYRTTHIGSVVDVQDMGDGVYMVTTVEGNMSNTVKSYRYLYDSKIDNHLVGTEKGLKLKKNMSTVDKEFQENPTIQYALHTDHWSVFGFCATW